MLTLPRVAKDTRVSCGATQALDIKPHASAARSMWPFTSTPPEFPVALLVLGERRRRIDGAYRALEGRVRLNLRARSRRELGRVQVRPLGASRLIGQIDADVRQGQRCMV